MSRFKKSTLLILIFIFCSCSHKLGTDLRREIVVGIEASPTSLDPRLARDAYSVQIIPLVFPGLFKIGENLEVEPDLVEKYFQIDKLSWQFELKKGIRFASGKELCAQDVVATIKSLLLPGINSPYLELAQKIKKIKILDKYKFQIQLYEPYAPFLVELCIGILPRKLAEKKELSPSELYGTGPYQLDKFLPGEKVVLKRNPYYSGQKPYFKRIIFRIIPDDTTRLLSLEKGEIQLVQNPIPPDEIERLKKNPRLKVWMRPGINYSYIGFNLKEPPLSNPLVRKAIAYAINRDEIIKCLLKDTVIKANSLLSPRHWAYEPDVQEYNYNPEKAKQLLDQAGYPDPDGDGPKARFHLVYKTSQNQLRIWIAKAIAYQLGKVGIDVKVRSLEWGTLFSDIQAGNFQIYSLTWVGVVEPDIFYTVFHSKSIPPKGANRGGYFNPLVDQLVEQARRINDRQKRKELYSKVQKILAKDLPYISLWYSKDIVVCDKRLVDFRLGPAGEWTGLATARFQQ